MSVLGKIFGREEAAEAPEAEEPQCPHTSLVPHWANADQMGKQELAVFTCTSCGDEFTYAETQALLDVPLPPTEAN